MDRRESILEALGALEPENDECWTTQGLPRIDIVRTLADDEAITRRMITEAAPEFTRDNPEIPLDDEETEQPVSDPEEGIEGDNLRPAVKVTLSAIDLLRNEVSEIEREREAQEAIRAEAAGKIDDLSRKRQRVRQRIHELERQDPRAKHSVITEYLAKQREDRARRASEGSAREASQLDRAMARKTKRATGSLKGRSRR